jgi:hypothetical protein
VKLVAKCGGDVFKFAGDALVALWPPEFVGEPTPKNLRRPGSFSTSGVAAAVAVRWLIVWMFVHTQTPLCTFDAHRWFGVYVDVTL